MKILFIGDIVGKASRKKILEDEKLKLDQEFDEINKKVEGLIDIIKNSYYE